MIRLRPSYSRPSPKPFGYCISVPGEARGVALLAYRDLFDARGPA